MSTELIIKGAFLGIGFFFVCRACYYRGFKDGGHYVLDMWKDAINEIKKQDDE